MEGRWLCAVMPTRRAQEEAADGTRSSGREGNVGLSIGSKNRHRFKEKKSTEKLYENGIYSVNTLRNPDERWELGCWSHGDKGFSHLPLGRRALSGFLQGLGGFPVWMRFMASLRTDGLPHRAGLWPKCSY